MECEITMTTTLIIGYGNPLRGDDGVGWLAAQRLAEAGTAAHAEVLIFHQLTPELAEPLSQVERAIFIDARVDGAAGTIYEDTLTPDAETTASITHEFDAPALLALALALYGRCAEATLLSVAAESFDYTDTLSPAVAAALDEVVARVRELTTNDPGASSCTSTLS
jgi:hydrogenase maturation protease